MDGGLGDWLLGLVVNNCELDACVADGGEVDFADVFVGGEEGWVGGGVFAEDEVIYEFEVGGDFGE